MNEFLAWLLSIASLVIPSLGEPPEPLYAGYAEAEFVYVAPTMSRRITEMTVAEGDWVAAGDLLFRMDAISQTAALRAAEARQKVAEANLRNLETGSRAEEIDVIRASLVQAEAELSLAESNLVRSKSLFERDIVTTTRVENDQAALERAQAHVTELRARLDVAELPARNEQIIAAQATLDAASAEVDLARATLDDLTVYAPQSGLVESVFFGEGEVAGAGTPVLNILPPGEIKIIFYIPETERLDFGIGSRLVLTCDGCSGNDWVTITRLASDPQYTPPIIYSREERARLVFRAEAVIDRDLGLLPGQPVTLTRLP